MKTFLPLPNLQKCPTILRKTAGDSRIPLKGFKQGSDKIGNCRQMVVVQWECKIQKDRSKVLRKIRRPQFKYREGVKKMKT